MTSYPQNPDEVARLLNESEIADELYKYGANGESPDRIRQYLINRYGSLDKAEADIIWDPVAAYYYALSVLKGRWAAAEPIIKQYPGWAYYYASDVIDGRWPEAEPYIMQNPEAAYYYVDNILKRRWPEYEQYMAKKNVSDNTNPLDDHEDSADDWWEEYQQDFIDD